jgi:acetyl esterase/lipase
MASWQAYVAAWAVRVRMKGRLARAANEKVVRQLFTPPVFPAPPEVEIEPAVVGGVAGEWLSRRGENGRVLVYLHGGGYIACSPFTHRAITVFYAQQGFRVFAPDYRIAPEHPFPAAVEDAWSVWEGLLQSGVRDAVISGESAGGGLCLATMLALRECKLPLPAAAAVFSPWVDLACAGDSIRANRRRCAMLSGPTLQKAAHDYLRGADPRSPLASPIYGDLRGLPPLLIHVGGREVLRDDSTRLAKRARAAGVPVVLRVWPVVPHAWQMAPHVLPEARESLLEASGFLQAALDAAGRNGSAA